MTQTIRSVLFICECVACGCLAVQYESGFEGTNNENNIYAIIIMSGSHFDHTVVINVMFNQLLAIFIVMFGVCVIVYNMMSSCNVFVVCV